MAKCLVFVFGLLAICWQVNCLDSKYDNYTLLKITPYTERHLEDLARISGDADEVEFLKRSYRVNDTTDVLVSPNKREVLEHLAHENGMPVEYKHYYGRSFLPVERGPQKRSLRSFDIFGFNSYETVCMPSIVVERCDPLTCRARVRRRVLYCYKPDFYAAGDGSMSGEALCALENYMAIYQRGNSQFMRGEILYEMRNYIENLPDEISQLVTVKEMGRSFQGRILYLIKISLNPEANNPIIFIDAGMEGRDWVGPAMAMYLIHRLTSDSRTLSRELHGVDWYIIPVVNPDGYEFSRRHRSNRLWKKTRSTTASEKCLGADVNRNFDYYWGVSGASRDPCTDDYCGYKSFSETEAQHIANIMIEKKNRIKLYVSLHSYGQYLVYPWGYTAEDTVKTEQRLGNLANMVSDSIVRAEGVPFKVMSAGTMFEPVAGSSDDYAFGVVGVPYSYRMLLTEGFEYTFPKELLSIVLPQYYEGFRTFSLQIRKEFSAL